MSNPPHQLAMTGPTLSSETPLGQYLASAGGYFHPALVSKQDAFGTSVFNGPQVLKAGSKVVHCPFTLAVTPTNVRRRIPTALFPSSPTSSRKSRQPNHELMALYLCLHTINTESAAAVPDLLLEHQVYVDHLPKSETMRTTLYFSDAERALLRGSNLHGATQDREEGWRAEWEEVRSWLTDKTVAQEVSWEKWLWACTILSSRAFPSSLIDGDKANSTPVLFPGIDMLNHRPTAKVTWASDIQAELLSDKGSLTIVLDEEVGGDAQVFNTYGAKSNEELLLGYGFTLTSNPADFHALKLALPPSCPPSLHDLLHTLKLDNLRHFVPRSGELPAELLAQMRLLVAQPDELDSALQAATVGTSGTGDLAWKDTVGFLSWENELDVLDALEGMLESKLQALYQGAEGVSTGDVRPEVAAMIEVYRKGQIDILEAALRSRERLFEDTIAKAEAAGVSLGFEDEEGMEDIEEGDETDGLEEEEEEGDSE